MMDIAGRRPLLLYPMLAMIVDLSAMTACFVLQVSTFSAWGLLMDYGLYCFAMIQASFWAILTVTIIETLRI